MNAMHPNSIDAFEQTGDTRQARCDKILAHYRICNAPLTDRQVMRGLKYSDMNSVRPRITELIELGMLREDGKAYDEDTGRNVRRVRYVHQNIVTGQFSLFGEAGE